MGSRAICIKQKPQSGAGQLSLEAVAEAVGYLKRKESLIN